MVQNYILLNTILDNRFTALIKAFSFGDEFQQSGRDKACLATNGKLGLAGFLPLVNNDLVKVLSSVTAQVLHEAEKDQRFLTTAAPVSALMGNDEKVSALPVFVGVADAKLENLVLSVSLAKKLLQSRLR